MDRIDRIVFGDNQFFGINHMSQEKAQQLAEAFHDIERIFEVYEMAFGAGIRAIMLNSNDRAVQICERFRNRGSHYPALSWYPSIPYPHKYANLVAEKGILPALNDILFRDESTFGSLKKITQGGFAVVSKDAIKLMQMLVDLEMKIFAGLDLRVVFLQNIVTDLLLGFGLRDFFYEYCEHVRQRYRARPGLITQNLPRLLDSLRGWGIEDVVICASVNSIGYLMSPNLAEYRRALADNDPRRYPIMAMSTLASGAIPVRAAYEFINALNLQSVVFGASSRRHIEETVRSIRLDGDKLRPGGT